jgi:hypothetical protein
MMKKIINIATQEQNIKVYSLSENVIAVPRMGETESGLIVVEIEGKCGTAYLDKSYIDILSVITLLAVLISLNNFYNKS